MSAVQQAHFWANCPRCQERVEVVEVPIGVLRRSLGFLVHRLYLLVLGFGVRLMQAEKWLTNSEACPACGRAVDSIPGDVTFTDDEAS